MGACGPRSVPSGLLGRVVSGECLRLGSRRSSLFDLPILIGDGSRSREADRDIALHLAEVKAYKSGMVELVTKCEDIAASHGTHHLTKFTPADAQAGAAEFKR